jgi:CheY-like chemotaxis protein
MAKILLVEDDNNLREIYQARLAAEGYEIVAAKDGEEALVVAKKERPDLVIADVMMPRVSGFEMLDIIRNTEGLKDVHVIMLTALGQAEDKTRADSLGADRYLVKSQVTLEDIVKTASDVLAGAPASITPGTQAAAAAAEQQQAAAPSAPTQTASIPVAAPPATPSDTTTTAPVPVTAPPAEPAATSAPSTPPADTSSTMPKLSIPVSTPPSDSTPPATPSAPATDTSVQTTPATPPTTLPSPTATNNTASDDKLVSDAVKDLMASTDTPEDKPATPAPAEPATPPATPPAPSPTPPPPPPAPVIPPSTLPAPPATPPSAPPLPGNGLTMQPVLPPAPSPTPPPTVTPPEPAAATPTPATNDDSVEVANKKIIQPLAAGSTPTPPDLHELLAKEGITTLDETPHPAAPYASAPHPPGHVISPGNGTPGTTPDPNSISL